MSLAEEAAVILLSCCRRRSQVCVVRLQVESVTANETGEPVKFAYTTVLMTEEYSVA